MGRLRVGLAMIVLGFSLSGWGILRGGMDIQKQQKSEQGYNPEDDSAINRFVRRKMYTINEKDLYGIASGLALIGGGLVVAGTSTSGKERRANNYDWKAGRQRVTEYRRSHGRF